MFTERSALDACVRFAVEIYGGRECPGRPYGCVDETALGSVGNGAVAENAIVRVATERMP